MQEVSETISGSRSLFVQSVYCCYVTRNLIVQTVLELFVRTRRVAHSDKRRFSRHHKRRSRGSQSLLGNDHGLDQLKDVLGVCSHLIFCPLPLVDLCSLILPRLDSILFSLPLSPFP